MSDADIKWLLEQALEAIRYGTTGPEPEALEYTQKAINAMGYIKDALAELEAKEKTAFAGKAKAA